MLKRRASASSASEPCAKKASTLHEDRDFTITISNPHSFKQLCEVISTVLLQTHFMPVVTSAFTGIKVDMVDPSMVCMVNARFSCGIVSKHQTIPRFCVRMKTLNTLLKQIGTQHILSIIKYTDGPDIILRAYDRTDETSNVEFILRTLDQERENFTLSNMNLKYTVEIELASFKSICKMCKDIKATTLNFSIMKDAETKDTYFTIRAQADEAGIHYMYRQPQEEVSPAGDKIVLNAMKHMVECNPRRHSTLDTMYSEHFSTELLNLFMKSMEKQVLHMDLGPGGPMVLQYNLGAEKSYIRFILASKDTHAPST